MKKTLLTLCVFVSMGIQAQKLPQLGKDPINKIVAAMTLEEKATLLVGYQVSNAGANIIRFIPPLVITKEHVDEMVDILESCLQ